MPSMKPQCQPDHVRCGDVVCSPECHAPDGDGGQTTAVKHYWDRIHQRILRYRTAFMLAAVTLFLGGLATSFAAADLSWQSLALPQILLILLVLAPMTIALAALSLQITAAAVDRRVGFSNAFSATAIANIAELLPLPGGAMVRGAALVQAGAKLSESTRIIILTALLTLFMVIAVSGIPLALARPSVGYAVLVAGLVGSGFSLVPIALRAGTKLTAAMIGVRLLAMALGVLRFVVAFGAIGAALDPVDAIVFVICAALASTVTLMPAGLGIAETLAATVALAVDISPAIAFMAVALNRVLGLTASALVFGGTLIARKYN